MLMLYKQAQAAIRARDEFMLIAGHELRTPLATLALHFDALANTPDGIAAAKVRDRAAKLRAQNEKLARLVEDLLDVSKISAGRLTIDRERIDLGALVRDVTDRMRDDFDRARCALTVGTDEVRGAFDRTRIDQVITNLLFNATKYAKGAPVHVELRRDGEYAVLTVADQGIGIAPEDQPRVFQRFERAVSSRKFGGLGLGLWITSQLVAAHGGTIAVDSQLNAGSTFTVRLPLELDS